jgi:hypothetical protein
MMQYGGTIVKLITYLLAARARGIFSITIPSGVGILNLSKFEYSFKT